MLMAGLIDWRINVLTHHMTRTTNNKLAREKKPFGKKKLTQYKPRYAVVADVIGWIE